MTTLDLRKHFGIWTRCGNTRFFKKSDQWGEVYLNPLDGITVSARDESKISQDKEPRYTFVVKNAEKASDGEVIKAFKSNQPWVERAVNQFFYMQALGWSLDEIKERRGIEPIPGDKDLGNFIRFYQSGAGDRQKYLEHGGSGPLDVPFLEETLAAILITINSMDGTTVDYGRNLSQSDLDEALAELGILECA